MAFTYSEHYPFCGFNSPLEEFFHLLCLLVLLVRVVLYSRTALLTLESPRQLFYAFPRLDRPQTTRRPTRTQSWPNLVGRNAMI